MENTLYSKITSLLEKEFPDFYPWRSRDIFGMNQLPRDRVPLFIVMRDDSPPVIYYFFSRVDDEGYRRPLEEELDEVLGLYSELNDVTLVHIPVVRNKLGDGEKPVGLSTSEFNELIGAPSPL